MQNKSCATATIEVQQLFMHNYSFLQAVVACSLGLSFNPESSKCLEFQFLEFPASVAARNLND